MNSPHLDEPTLGVIVGDDFYYIANPQWDGFDGEKNSLPAREALGDDDPQGGVPLR